MDYILDLDKIQRMAQAIKQEEEKEQEEPSIASSPLLPSKLLPSSQPQPPKSASIPPQPVKTGDTGKEPLNVLTSPIGAPLKKIKQEYEEGWQKLKTVFDLFSPEEILTKGKNPLQASGEVGNALLGALQILAAPFTPEFTLVENAGRILAAGFTKALAPANYRLLVDRGYINEVDLWENLKKIGRLDEEGRPTTGSTIGDILTDVATTVVAPLAWEKAISSTAKAPRQIAQAAKTLNQAPTQLDEALRIVSGVEQTPKKSLLEKVKELPKKLQVQYVSEFTPLTDLEEAVYASKGWSLKDIIAKTRKIPLGRSFEQIAGAQGKAEAAIWEFREKVIKPVKDRIDLFNAYIFLRRTQNRLLTDPEKRKVGYWTLERVDTALKQLEAQIGADGIQLFNQQAKKHQQMMDMALKFQVASGRMSKETYNKIKELNDFYAPFQVLTGLDEAAQTAGLGRKIDDVQNLTKRIVGLEHENFQLKDIMKESAAQLAKSIILAEKNMKMLKLDELAKLDTDEMFLRRIRVTHFYPIEDKKTGEIIGRGLAFGERPRPGFKVVEYFKDGVKTALEVPEDVARAIEGLNPVQADLVSKSMLMSKTIFRAGVTTFNLAFQVRNLLFADLPRLALVSEYGIRSPKDIIPFIHTWIYSLATAFKGNFGKPNDLYLQFMRSPAFNTTIQRFLTPETFRVTLGIEKESKGIVGTILDTAEKISNAIEETSKIAGFKRGLEIEKFAAASPFAQRRIMEKIAFEVRNYAGSPDFFRKGTASAGLNLLFMFFNARIQGTAADLSRLFGKQGAGVAARAWTKLTTAVALPATALAFWNTLGPYSKDYDTIPEWEKSNYFIIFNGRRIINEDGVEVADAWRIPKREIVQMISNSIENFVRFLVKKDPERAKEIAMGILENISPVNLDGKTPVQRIESIISSMNPMIRFPIEVATGRNLFQHRPVIPQYMQGAKPSEQYRTTTAKPIIAIGKALGVSPLWIEQLISSFTGTGIIQYMPREMKMERGSLAKSPIGRIFVRSGGVEEPPEIREALEQAQQEDVTQRVKRKRAVEEIMRRWNANNVSDDGRLREIAEIARQDMELAKKLLEAHKRKQLGMTYTEVAARGLGAKSGARAQFVQQILSGVTDPAERREQILDLYTKGIITADVLRQILISNPELLK